MSEDNPKAKFAIYRAKDAKELMDEGCMTFEPPTTVQLQGMGLLEQAGLSDGQEIRVLVNIPGFSLTHVWFKRDYPLPLHSHDADCLYYIIAGSLRMGTEELGPRDSFFLPAETPYTYRPGPDGVELLEIRHANAFNFVAKGNSLDYWAKLAATAEANREHWKTAAPPLLNA